MSSKVADSREKLNYYWFEFNYTIWATGCVIQSNQMNWNSYLWFSNTVDEPVIDVWNRYRLELLLSLSVPNCGHTWSLLWTRVFIACLYPLLRVYRSRLITVYIPSTESISYFATFVHVSPFWIQSLYSFCEQIFFSLYTTVRSK